MVDIDEILAAAIRTVWLQVDGPESRSHYHVEVESAQRVRAALEREGVIITQARPMPEAAAPKEEEGRKDAGDVVDNIDARQKVRCLEEKKGEASISENWNVVSFWVKLFAFSGLLMAQFAGWAESLGRVDGYRKI